MIFRSNSSLDNGCPDGTSNTIAFGERYAQCGITSTDWSVPWAICYDSDGNQIPWVNPVDRRSAFIDPMVADVKPITGPDGTAPSVEGLTFQAAPPLNQCDYRVLQTPHASGMIVALLDGSTRIITSGVSPAVYWGAITPNGGEVNSGW